MPTLTLTEEQLVQLIDQLPADRKRDVLLRLAQGAEVREENLNYGEEQMRRLAKERGLRWDAMSDEQRIQLVDDLIHEDRACGR